MILFAFYKGKGSWLDQIIRLWTRGKYSHVEVIFQENGRLKWYSAGTEYPYSVRAKYANIDPNKWDIIEVPISEDKEAFAHNIAKSMIGHGYDWSGVFFSMVLRLNFHSPKRESCNEFTAKIAKAAGIDLSDDPNMYSPSKFYKILKDKGY